METTVQDEAVGLPADWLNGWLAAIGVTVLVPGVKLSWSDEVGPHAVFIVPEGTSLPDAIAGALPTLDDLDGLVIARRHPDAALEFGRRVGFPEFRERAAIEREVQDHTLSVSVSDTEEVDDGEVLPHGAFDPTAPRGETLFSRVRRCREAMSDPLADAVAATLRGTPTVVKANGLGFNCRRLASGVRGDDRAPNGYVDPVVELLAFAALRLFPVRASGVGRRALQRGWRASNGVRGAFSWTAWSDRLDCWAIDAFLDDQRSGILGRWQTVPLRRGTAAGGTWFYFSEPAP